MAFDVNGQVGGYGNESLGDVTNPVNINSYAQVTGINGNTITLGSIQNGNYEKFTVGTTIIITAALTNGANNQSIGYHTCHVITAVNGNVLTLNWGCPIPNWNQFFIQAITVPNFRNITISGENLSDSLRRKSSYRRHSRIKSLRNDQCYERKN